MNKPPKAATALFAASLDPITNGHLSLIEKAATLFPSGLTVLVATNPKKAGGTFSVQKRMEIARAALSHLPNVKVTTAHGVFTADFARRNGIRYLVRGIRSASDTDAEMRIARYNERIAPEVQTFAIPAPSVLGDISSSELKGLVGFHGWIDLALEMAPEASVQTLIEMETERRFEQLTKPHGLDEFPNWDGIQIAYKNYPYHNLEHILRSIEWLNVLGLSHDMEMIAALFMHDIVRDEKTDTENVEASAEVARRCFAKGYKTNKIVSYIRATDHSKEPPTEKKEALIHDIDLAILGANPTSYQRYQTQIEREYSYLGKKKFHRGRIDFLEAMRKKPKIFLTKEFEGLEAQAHRNMQEEAKKL